MKAKRRVAARVYSVALIGAARAVVGAIFTAAMIVAASLWIFNVASGIVAGVWLAFLGQWGLIWAGIVLGATGHLLISLFLVPSCFLFGMPGLHFLENGKRLPGYFFLALSQIYLATVITFWCMGILLYFGALADDSSLIPMLLWSYDTAVTPLVFLARHDLRAGNEWFWVVFAEVGFAIVVLLMLFSRPTFVVGCAVLASTMCVGAVVGFAVAVGRDILAQPSVNNTAVNSL